MTRKAITTSIVSASLLLSSFGFVYAGDLVIDGNGTGSTNKIKVEDVCNSTVAQFNDAAVEVLVDAKSSTGKNQANSNTGSDVEVETGEAKTEAGVEVVTGGNVAEANNCCDCGLGELDATIKDNGSDSYNKVKVEELKNTTAAQHNNALVGVLANLKAKNGKNKANDNTGGNVTVKTGKASSLFSLFASFGSNVLVP